MIWVVLLLLVHQCIATNNWVKDLNPIALSDVWSPVDQVLEYWMQNQTYPGAVALVANAQGILYFKAFGNFTYGENGHGVIDAPMKTNSVFDMASCTKVIASTTAAMTFYQRGELDLNMPLMNPYLLGPKFGNNGKQSITALNLLLHNAGFPADPIPGYSDPEFGCPATDLPFPPQVFTCQNQIYNSVMTQTLINPVGQVYLYSDLSMITMMFVIGTLARNLKYVTPNEIMADCPIGNPGEEQCYYEAYIRKYVIERYNMTSSMFRPPKHIHKHCVPTWNDTTYRNKPLQGEVSDENAYALGGIAGHAGLFSTATDLYSILKQLMFSGCCNTPVNQTTLQYFITEYNHTQSSRALGWETNDYEVDQYRGCGNLSSNTYYHTGYTGTQVCNDPERQLITILLTNRVWPGKTNNMGTIQLARQAFNNQVKNIVDKVFLYKSKTN